MSRPLSVKHAAKITFGQYKCRTFHSIIYPADKNNFTGISSILAWGKSRVGLPPPFIAIHRKSIMLMHRPQTPQPGFGSIYTLLQKFTPHFKILDPRLEEGREGGERELIYFPPCFCRVCGRDGIWSPESGMRNSQPFSFCYWWKIISHLQYFFVPLFF